MDVENAYLAGDLQEEIYMKPPPGLPKDGPTDGRVYRLQKSLYGLKQSARIWNRKITEFFISQGFQALSTDYSVLTKGGIRTGITVAIYMDDILIFRCYIRDILYLKRNLSKRFKMKDLGEAQDVLNIYIE